MSVFPGPTNVYVPTFSPGASGALQTEFSRNPASFALNQYVQVVPVSKRVGKYLRINPDDGGRVESTAEYSWPDGQNRPRGGEADHEFVDYATERYAYSFQMGNITVEQADWDIVAAHGRSKAQKAMTARTLRMNTLLNTAGNWPADNTDTATAVGGGVWLASTEANGFIQAGIQGVRLAVLQATVGAVDMESEFVMVMGPTVATEISQAPEIKSYIKNYPRGEDFLRGQAVFNQWGLPPELWGVRVVVDSTVRVSSVKDVPPGTTASTKVTLWDNPGTGNVVFLSRPGGLIGTEGVPSFSTASVYVYAPEGGPDGEGRGGDMFVETRTDDWNRITMGSVVEDVDEVLTAPISGFLLTNVLS